MFMNRDDALPTARARRSHEAAAPLSAPSAKPIVQYGELSQPRRRPVESKSGLPTANALASAVTFPMFPLVPPFTLRGYRPGQDRLERIVTHRQICAPRGRTHELRTSRRQLLRFRATVNG